MWPWYQPSWRVVGVGVVLVLLGIGVIALAQQDVVVNGVDVNGKARRIQVDPNGAPVATSLCTSPRHTVVSVGTSSGNVPATQLAGRRKVVICNSPENSGTPKVKCRIDGTAPAMGTGNAGDPLLVGDCIEYAVTADTSPLCVADTAATAVTALECK